MGACSTSDCCGTDGNNIDTNQQMSDRSSMMPFTSNNLFEVKIADQKQLAYLENLINQGISTGQLCREISQDIRATLSMLTKMDKTVVEYELLCFKDAQLSFKAMDYGSLKYVGQVRLMPVYANSETSSQAAKNQYRAQQGNDSVVDYAYERCGYGKMIWPDTSSFEGYWINGQACGLGVFRSQHQSKEVYEGFWQLDRSTNLSVFRQNHGLTIESDLDAIESQSDVTGNERQNGKGVEVWSDGSYYHGFFKDGVKQGEGVYFWADGSKYTGAWDQDEMSGEGIFEWSDGRYFQGAFQNGVMHGFGCYVWQDGRRYEGEYQFNKKHGLGTYTYSDGSKYKGNWKDGMQHGEGCIIDAQSVQERSGIWECGKIKQWIKMEINTITSYE